MVLTGDGSDEVLSGFTIHQGEKFSRYYQMIPPFIRYLINPLGTNLIGALPLLQFKKFATRSKNVTNAATKDFAERMELKSMGFTDNQRESLLLDFNEQKSVRSIIENTISKVKNRDNMTKLNYFMLKVHLADDMLTKVDRMSMANSLETRIPFLDHRIVELLASVSMKVKLKGFKRKNVLRQSFGNNLPKELLRQKKKGFWATFSRLV